MPNGPDVVTHCLCDRPFLRDDDDDDDGSTFLTGLSEA